MRKYLTLSCLFLVLLSGVSFAKTPPLATEIVGVGSVSYNKSNNTLELKVSHSAGCGTWWDYSYIIKEVDELRKEVTLEVLLETDNICEAAVLKKITMKMPDLPFKPVKLIFYKKNQENITVSIP
ncbi:MAG: hypothetical protein R3D71_04155 [Rickettsiales bacterium]